MNVKSWDIVAYGGRSAPGRGGRRTGEREERSGERPGERPGQPTAFVAELGGFQAVPPILTGARGRFRAELTPDGALEYELWYENLSGPATQAHIHFGQPGVNGEVVVFLCGEGDAPACPGAGGRVAGRIEPEDIVAVPQQGVEAGDLAGVIRAMRAGATYVNVHTPQFPAGEIRGQIRPQRR